MRLERKGVQGSLSQPIRSMIVLAANELPGGSDTSSGIERRRLVVPFSKIVPPHERRDLDLEFRPFLAGLLAAALAIPTDEVTQLIRSTNTAIPALAQVHLDSLIETNSMAAWVDDCLTLDPSVSTPIGTGDPAMADVHLYASYVAFCKLSGSHPVSLRRFSPALLDLLKVQLRVKDIEKVRSKKGYTVTGIRIRSPHDYSEKIVSGVGSEVVGVGSVQGRCRVETQSVQEVHSVQGENAAEIKNEKKEAGIPDKTQEREENREKSDLSYTPNTSCTARVSTLHSPYTDPTPPYIADTLPVSVESTCEDMQDPIVEVQSETMKGLYREFGFSDAILIQDIETVTGILIKDFRWGGMSQGQYVQVYSCLEARIEAQATPEALES
jgi:phage/plasmid-associated DNA primase